MLKSISIASYNWKVLLKSLFCQVLVLAIMLAFLITFFGGLAADILRVITESNVLEFIRTSVESIIDGSFNSAQFTSQLNGLIETLQQNINSIHYPWGGVTMSYVVALAVLLVYRLFVSYTDVTVACQIEEFMTSNAQRPFLWFLFKKQGRTWAFSSLQMLCSLPLDIMIVSGALGLYLLFLIAFGWWTIIPVCVLILLLYTARHTFFAFCLPAVACEDMPAAKAFVKGISQIPFRFWKVFWKNLIVMSLMMGISLVGILYVDNGWARTAVISIPNFILFFVVKCINLVEYFEANERPYFHKRVLIEGTDVYKRKRERDAKRNKKVK